MEPHTSPRRRRTVSITRRAHHRRGSVANEQTNAHVPTLKGLGKSDCEVKIVSVLECETLVPVDALLDRSSCMPTLLNLLAKLAFLLILCSTGCQ
jgi:hypothetical protein